MGTKPVALRYDCEASITKAIAALRQEGVHRDDLEARLMALGPVDLDLLAAVLRRLDMAKALGETEARAA
ncbi:hypothetical protein ACLB6G_02885 [Zhengella sp. ZM62]|uniref:hypothetical protein n=1 Tax=Zhengella sedimenti TaxID=3390035 RepID=UPI00397625F8